MKLYICTVWDLEHFQKLSQCKNASQQLFYPAKYTCFFNYNYSTSENIQGHKDYKFHPFIEA